MKLHITPRMIGFVLAVIFAIAVGAGSVYLGWYANPTIRPQVVITQYPIDQVIGYTQANGPFYKAAALTAPTKDIQQATQISSGDFGKDDIGTANQ